MMFALARQDGRRPLSRRARRLSALALAVALTAAGCTAPASPDPEVPSAAADAPSRPAQPDDAALTTYSYGPRPAQTADLILPASLTERTEELRTPSGSEAPAPQVVDVVVLVHGGGWDAAYDRSSETEVARDLTDDGIVVWNLDYRGVGAADPLDEGGWPGTFEDVAAGLDLLPQALGEAGLAPGRVAVVGHSAGGTMALWLAARHTLPDGAPGAAPLVRPDLVVTQAGVNDLKTAGAEGPVEGAVQALMGGSTSEVRDDRYDLASPTALLPLGVPTLVTTGDLDAVVVPSVATDYAEAAQAAGDDVTLAVIPGEDHLSPQNPRSDAWAAVRDWLAERGIAPAGSTR
ncbi:alpha/beta hydrolase family protein [Oerskovia sp. NPDC060287]|uniref:alpha/beta hydrolase family protein n=1 Tax=Oerskovia sp. NPDC060287 TaxID=3347095 RepID=UPI00365276FC